MTNQKYIKRNKTGNKKEHYFVVVVETVKYGMVVIFKSDLFTSYIFTIFKQ